ncbi:uncharacterized protein LOC128132198 isoform X2 [Lactuca sativa]|uniref:uncharacterized protein LOC128132198 isoform X2 n=1 Tax=Lactuca sativa TaxID=4236 RepID=UPI0022AEF4D0|nr:uncharacterized protein LOC128132198 isoform X2 [Lactuca sativa]
MENTSHARSKWSREARLPTTTTVGWWLCRLQPPCATGGVMFLERVCVLLLIGKAQGETAMAAMVVAATRHRRPPQDRGSVIQQLGLCLRDFTSVR